MLMVMVVDRTEHPLTKPAHHEPLKYKPLDFAKVILCRFQMASTLHPRGPHLSGANRGPRPTADQARLTAILPAPQRVTVTSKTRDREVNIRIILHISYIDQLVVPAKFNFLIGAKNVDRI